MDTILLLAGLSLMLCFWILYLQHKVRMLLMALEGASMMVVDLANGDAVIEKEGDSIRIRKVKQEKNDGR